MAKRTTKMHNLCANISTLIFRMKCKDNSFNGVYMYLCCTVVVGGIAGCGRDASKDPVEASVYSAQFTCTHTHIFTCICMSIVYTYYMCIYLCEYVLVRLCA